MKQMFYGPPELPRFGILHLPPSGEVGDTGVVITPPFGNEYLRSYRSLKLLADRIAKHGYPVFRFDLTGTGDAGGDDFEMDLPRWREDLAAAMERLGAETGVARFHLVGRRLGAALSLEAAAGNPQVDRVALWDPFPTGRYYLDDLREEHQAFLSMYRGVHGSIREAAEGEIPFALELLGQCFPDAFLSQLEAWEVCAGRDVAGVKGVLLDTSEDCRLRDYCAALAAGGAALEYLTRHDPSAKDPTNPIRVYLPNKVMNMIVDSLAAVAS